MNEIMDTYEIWELCSQIRSTINCMQRYIQNENDEPERDTLYNCLEGIRLKADIIELIMAQPVEDRLSVSDVRQIAAKLHMNEEQIYALLYKEDKQNERKTA